jgi:hypothetical protein
MKTSPLLSSTFVVIFLLAAATAYASTVSRFQANGVSAYANACINNCSSQAVLTLLQSKSAGKNLYYVYFDIYGQDSRGNVTDINAVGLVPARMVSGDGHNHLSLKLDTDVARIPVSFCIMDGSGNYACSPYSGGIINISWTTTKQFSSRASGQYTNTYANFTVHNNYHSEMSSATVEADILGTQYSDAGSALGNGHDGAVTITKP